MHTPYLIGKRRTCASVASVLLALGISMPVQAAEFLGGRVEANGALRVGWQSLEADQNAFNPAFTMTESGFHRIRFNLNLNIKLSDRVSAFVDLAEEHNDFGSSQPFSIVNDLAYIDIKLSDQFTFRAGEIVTSIVNFRGYSDGAQVQGNPLIGNSPADMLTAETGIQLLGSHPMGAMRLNWDAAVSSPTFAESFSGDQPYNWYFKGALDFGNGFSIGAGYAFNDGGDQVNGPTPVGNVLTMGLVRGDNENYGFPGDGNETHVFLVPGVEVDIFHVDAQFVSGPLTLRAWYGMAEDNYSFVDAGNNQTVRNQAVNVIRQQSEMNFFGGTVAYDIVPDKFYVAGRYVRVTNESPGAGSDDEVERFQVGAGWWMEPNFLWKAEYVTQKEGANSAGQVGDDWDGFLIEGSMTF